MKIYACLLVLIAMVFAGCRTNRTEKPLDALREIRIERRTILRLGGEMPQASTFCNWNGPTCTLNPGTFGGAERMSVSKTESGVISQFQFYYGVMSEDAVNAQIGSYTRLLGKPSRDSTAKTDQFDVRELDWSDSATTFELSYKTDRKQTEGSARLFDNALAGPTH